MSANNSVDWEKVVQYLLTAAALFAGGFALVQLGQMLAQSKVDNLNERPRVDIAKLEAEIAKLKSEKAKLEADLQFERMGAVQLRRENEAGHEALSSAAESKRALSAEVQRVQKDQAVLKATMESHKPLFVFSFDLTDAPKKIKSIGTNKSSTTIRVVRWRRSSWIDGKVSSENTNVTVLVVPPATGISSDFLVAGDLEPIKSGSQTYRIAECVIYEDAIVADQRRWLHEYWIDYKYAPNSGIDSITYWKRDDKTVGLEEDCNLNQLMPRGWLTVR